MKLSLIIPVYNAMKYLDKCLSSIVNEMDELTEIIIIDDGSIDKSEDIYNKYKSKNVQCYKNENHGTSFSRNFGINKAKGEYICFVDSDDFMTTGWKETVYKQIENQADVVIFEQNIDVKLDREKLLEYIFKYKCPKNNICLVPSKIYRKEFLVKNNIIFDEGVINGEDMLFNAKCILASNNTRVINKNIYNYRSNPLSVTNTFNSKIFESDKKFLMLMKEIFQKYDISRDDICKYCVENAIMMFIRRLCFLKTKQRKKYTYIFKEEPYKSYIANSKKYKNKEYKFVIKNIKFNNFYIIWIYMNLKSILKRFLKSIERKEIIIEI